MYFGENFAPLTSRVCVCVSRRFRFCVFGSIFFVVRPPRHETAAVIGMVYTSVPQQFLGIYGLLSGAHLFRIGEGAGLIM